MTTVSSHRPVLFVHPDRKEANYLRERLRREGVVHPILICPSVDDARDYLTAASVALPVDARYTPCLTFIDESVGGAEIRDFTQWIREQPALKNLRVVCLTSEEGSAGDTGVASGADNFIGPHDRVRLVRTLIVQECQEN